MDLRGLKTSSRGASRRCAALAGACALWALMGCLADPAPAPPEPQPPLSDDGWTPVEPAAPAGWPALAPSPDNPYTPIKAILGRRLFREVNLSRDQVVSCMWCHDPVVAFTFKHGGLGSGVGLKPTLRGPATLINVAFATTLMSEGKARSLEEQALLPLYAENEMDMNGPEIEQRLQADTAYVRLFREAFGPGPIRMDQVVKALATYQRTLISYRSDYDRWQAGDENALSPEARQGAALFFGKAGCARCHVPPLFTDQKFHNIGLDSIPVDKGRMFTTGLAADAGKFKTPTLRNIFQTEPYMHDGRFTTPEQVVEHYNAGPMGAGSEVVPLRLSDRDLFELVEFLKTLTDPAVFAEPF